MYNKGAYQVVRLRWLFWNFTVPICPEDAFFLGVAHIIIGTIILYFFFFFFLRFLLIVRVLLCWELYGLDI